ncbi:MAG: NADH-quinone oxidoreductase subunit N, partial [Mycobacterium sp.]|nr:NADH-quinone oxidoreductase subunit N [Mycobacterium sp.]
MTAPSVAYGQLAPMLIVFGVAVVGVLVEAFLPRKLRYRAQLSLSLAGLFVALIWVLRVTLQLRGGVGNSVVAGAVDIDRPTLFLWATILLIGVLSVLLIAERRAESPVGAVALDAFTPDASTVPGSVAEKVATKAALIQTEVFPLTMFAIGGMMLFPAAGDFLTMFVALEVLSL